MAKREDKVKQVEKLVEGLKESEVVVFADYSGLSVGETSELRKKLKELGAQFGVAKNTLIKLAIAGAKLPSSDLVGPTAVLLSRGGDPIECVKAVVSLFKEVGKGNLPAQAGVKFGIFNGSLMDAAEVSELALIPSKTILQGRLVWLLNSPLSRFVSVLQENQRGLVCVLSEVVKLSEAKSASGGRKGGESQVIG